MIWRQSEWCHTVWRHAMAFIFVSNVWIDLYHRHVKFQYASYHGSRDIRQLSLFFRMTLVHVRHGVQTRFGVNLHRMSWYFLFNDILLIICPLHVTLFHIRHDSFYACNRSNLTNQKKNIYAIFMTNIYPYLICYLKLLINCCSWIVCPTFHFPLPWRLLPLAAAAAGAALKWKTNIKKNIWKWLMYKIRNTNLRSLQRKKLTCLAVGAKVETFVTEVRQAKPIMNANSTSVHVLQS